MYKKLILFIKEKILSLEEEKSIYSKDLAKIRNVYFLLKPDGKEFDDKNMSKLLKREEILDDMVSFLEKSNDVIVKALQKNLLDQAKTIKELEDPLKRKGLSFSLLNNSNLLNYLKMKNSANYRHDDLFEKVDSLISEYNTILQKLSDIVTYFCKLIINRYENFNSKKESLKEQIKYLKNICKDISKNNQIDIKYINYFLKEIENIEDPILKKEISDLFKQYNEEHLVIKNKDEEPKKEPVKVVSIILEENFDDKNSILEDKTDLEEAKKYLEALKCFEETLDIYEFLNSIGKSKLSKLSASLFGLLGNDKQDIIIKEAINKLLCDDLEEPLENVLPSAENKILYYDFLTGKNKIFSDIKKKIPEEYYEDVIKGLNLIKERGIMQRVNTIRKVSKVFKIRIGDIRIAFKRLSNNVYIILGIYCKKDAKGFDIIESIEERNKILLEKEMDIVEAMKNDTIWNLYTDVNDGFEKEIREKLNKKKLFKI